MIKAFVLGVFEFRLSVTTGFADCDRLHAYEVGRELAHRFTFRQFDC